MPVQGVLRHCYGTVLIINDLVLATYLFHEIKHNLMFKYLMFGVPKLVRDLFPG